MYNLVISSKCKKDLKLAKKQGRDMDRIFLVVDMLVNKQVLPEEFDVKLFLLKIDIVARLCYNILA